MRYDTLIIGHISKDININYEGKVVDILGGAVIYSSYAAQAGENKTAVLTKMNVADMHYRNEFNVGEDNVFCLESKKTTSIKNQYLSEDKEKRDCTALAVADSFTIGDIPNIESRIFHLAGLIVGDFNEKMIPMLAKKGKVAVDVQGFLRNEENGKMVFRDWKNKKELLKDIFYLKTDAAEAEIMTGFVDRKKAAIKLAKWGAKEIMITHHTEVLIYSDGEFYTQPLKPRNLSGRTGRGDTCFSAYITERNRADIQESLLYAAALVSMKMEKSEPFKGTRSDVESYIEKYYKCN